MILDLNYGSDFEWGEGVGVGVQLASSNFVTTGECFLANFSRHDPLFPELKGDGVAGDGISKSASKEDLCQTEPGITIRYVAICQ